MIPWSAAHALHFVYRAQWQTSWGRFYRQLVRSTLQSQRRGAIIDPSHVSGDSVFPLPIPFLDAEFDRTAQELFPQRLEQPKEWRSVGVAPLTNMFCSPFLLYTMVGHKAAELFSSEAEEKPTAHSI